MRWIVVIAAGVALGVVAYDIQVDDLHSQTERAAAQVVLGWTYIGVGLLAWIRRRGNLIGPLLVAAGAAWLARQLRYANDAALFTLFFLFGDLCYALVGHAVLAYPTGKLRGRLERGIAIAGYATALIFPLAALLLYDGRSRLLQMQPFHTTT